MSVQRSGGEPLLNDTWVWQSRNAVPGEGGDGTPNEVVWDNMFEHVIAEPISPPRGYDWEIYKIDWSWHFDWEDDSGDNVSEHLTGLLELSEDDLPSLALLGGGNLPTETFGDARGSANSNIDIQANHNEGPWISVVGDTTASYHITEGTAGAGVNGVYMWDSMELPEPVRISDRTEIDCHTSYVGPFGTTQGDVQIIHSADFTVWYKEHESEHGGSIR